MVARIQLRAPSRQRQRRTRMRLRASRRRARDAARRCTRGPRPARVCTPDRYSRPAAGAASPASRGRPCGTRRTGRSSQAPAATRRAQGCTGGCPSPGRTRPRCAAAPRARGRALCAVADCPGTRGFPRAAHWTGRCLSRQSRRGSAASASPSPPNSCQSRSRLRCAPLWYNSENTEILFGNENFYAFSGYSVPTAWSKTP
jgi:hypothetical protein